MKREIYISNLAFSNHNFNLLKKIVKNYNLQGIDFAPINLWNNWANLKKKICTAYPPEEGDGEKMAVKGRDLVNGIPKEIVLTQRDVCDAISEPVGAIIDAVKRALENTPPELAADIVDRGIILTGGGSLMAGIDTVLRKATGLPVTVAEEALLCVVLGTGKVLEDRKILQNVLKTTY